MSTIFTGFSKADITPDLSSYDVYGLGYWYERSLKFKSILDPLYVRCIAIGEGNERYFIFSVDAIWDSMGFSKAATLKISREFCVPPQNIFIICTHSHSTPLIGLNNTNKGIKYGKFVAKQILTSARNAANALEEVVVKISKVKAKNIIFNRRPLLKNGKVAELHTNIDSKLIKDFGIVNEDMTLIKFITLDNHLLGALCHYGIHNVCMQCAGKISSDCMGRAIQRIEKKYDDKIVVLHLNAPCGDIDPIKMGSLKVLHLIESNLYRKIKEGLKRKGIPISIDLSQAIKDSYRAKRRKTKSVENIEKLKNLLRTKYNKKENLLSHHSGYGYKLFLLEEEKKVSLLPEKVDINYQIIKIGKIIIVGVSGEIFTCFGNQLIKSRKNFLIFPVGITGDWNGYLPPRKAFNQGGYEVANATWCIIEQGESEKLFKEIVKKICMM